MRCTRIIAGPDGRSRFEDVDVPLAEVDYAPPAPPMGASDPLPARRSLLGRLPPGWFGDWHPSPTRQLFVQLAGEIEVTVGDGERRRFRVGDVVLVEDTTGPGHTTRVVGTEAARCLFVHLD
jgi:hypothetical protein